MNTTSGWAIWIATSKSPLLNASQARRTLSIISSSRSGMPRGTPGSRKPAARAGRSGSRADDDQVLLLKASVVVRAEVPLIAEPIEGVVELPLASVLARVVVRGDRRPVLRLEVLAIVARMLEG